jgi:hypothetical protein
LTPRVKFAPRGEICPQGVKFVAPKGELSPQGQSYPPGVKTLCSPLRSLKRRVCLPLGVNEGVVTLKRRVCLPLGVNEGVVIPHMGQSSPRGPSSLLRQTSFLGETHVVKNWPRGNASFKKKF